MDDIEISVIVFQSKVDIVDLAPARQMSFLEILISVDISHLQFGGNTLTSESLDEGIVSSTISNMKG